MPIERKHPNALNAVVIICVLALGLAIAWGNDVGLPWWLVMVLGLLALCAAAWAFFAFDRARSEAAEEAFLAVEGRSVAALRVGHVARTEVVIAEPTTLIAPLSGSRCAYYRAAAIVSTAIDAYDDSWNEARVRFEGELARARDDSGEVELDLRSGVELVAGKGLRSIPCREEPRDGDPLGVGIAEKYKVSLHTLQAGDRVEVVGRVERGAAGRSVLVPVDGKLQLRVVELAVAGAAHAP